MTEPPDNDFDLRSLLRSIFRLNVAIVFALVGAVLGIWLYWSGQDERTTRRDCTLTEETAPVGLAGSVYTAHRYDCPDGSVGWARAQ